MNGLKRGVMAVCGLLSFGLALSALAAPKLAALRGDPRSTSVSGLSSGGYMAVQYEVAFSASVKGAGIVAGGPYYCAAGSPLNAAVCTGQVAYLPPVASFMVSAAKAFAAAGKIDSLDNLRTHRIYVFTGTNDPIVRRPAVDALVAFYKGLGVRADALQYVTSMPAGHAIITADYGNDCASSASPGLNHCSVGGKGYDQAGVILRQIYGPLQPPARVLGGRLQVFDQTEFTANAKMANEGYVYVPHACAAGAACRLHIAFHGCLQSAGTIGDKFYTNAGYNRWADTNQIIVMYPQVASSFTNPQGCWDWFGYTGPDYAIKSGPQLQAVKAMSDRLLSGS